MTEERFKELTNEFTELGLIKPDWIDLTGINRYFYKQIDEIENEKQKGPLDSAIYHKQIDENSRKVQELYRELSDYKLILYRNGIDLFSFLSNSRFLTKDSLPITGISEITIPEGIQWIDDRTFANSDYKHISFPNTLTRLGESVFSGSDIEGIVDLSNTHIRILYSKTFVKTPHIQTVLLPVTLKSINSRAFSDSGIEYITLPPAVQNIDYNAFNHCDKLSLIILNEGLTNIDDNAFVHLPQLKEITLPSTLNDSTIDRLLRVNTSKSLFDNTGIKIIYLKNKKHYDYIIGNRKYKYPKIILLDNITK